MLSIAIVLAIVMSPAGLAAAEDDAVGRSLQQSMIWLDSAPFGKEVYAAFRKQWQMESLPKRATLHIFADTRYMLWINGRYVERGPCRFVPAHPEYDTLDVTSYLRQGKNVLAVVVHHFHDGVMKDNGSEVNGRVARHVPGLTAMLDITDRDGRHTSLSTDTSWRGSTKTQFGPSGISKGFIVDHIDARREPLGWMLAGFDDSSWEKPVSIDGRQWGPLGVRTIPLLRETEVKPLLLMEQSGKQVRRPLADALPIDLKPGEQIVIDTVQFVLAYSILDIEAEDGSEIELKYASTYANTRPRPDDPKNANQYMGRDTSRYIARAGRQTYMSGDTAGCKYPVIRLKSGKVRLHGVQMINRMYPFEVVGRFQSNDAMLNHLWQLGINTVRLCSEDAYVDSSTNERASWLGDGTVVEAPITRVALAGPGTDGKPWYADPRLLRQKVWQVGHCVMPDGRVKAFAPSDGFDKHGYIEDYACLWIQGIRAYYDITGELETVRGLWPAVTKQLKWFLDRRSPRGLVNAREFVTWGNPLIYKVCEGATLNAYIYRSLLDAAELARQLDKPEQQREYEAAANALKSAINTHLWDDKAGAYHGAIRDGEKTPLTAYAAVLCLYFDVVPPERKDRVNQWLLANYEKEDFYTYGCAFLFEVLYRMDSAVADQLVLDKIRKRWAQIAKSETQTVWAEDVGGVCCHIYGATPTYFLSRHVLGVGVDGPTRNRRIVIDPRLGDLRRVEGTVVTDFGPVPVLWDKSDDGKKFAFRVEIPDSVTAKLRLPRLGETSVVTLDGHEIKPVEQGRSLELELRRGKHVGVVRTAEPSISREVFKVEGHDAFLAAPAQRPAGSLMSWVWYAPAFSSGLPAFEEDWMFEKFLGAGIAVVGVDVGESCGSPQGRRVYSALYHKLVSDRGFSKRPCLLAQSRGGLMLYNWAVEHPSSVACIAGIYPVCDLRSYPGLGKACGAYGMTEEQLAARLTEYNPIDRVEPLARAGVPIFHLHGDSDTVVPLTKNSAALAERYRQFGGTMTLKVVKGQGHNAWPGFFQCQELVDFVVTHAKERNAG